MKNLFALIDKTVDQGNKNLDLSHLHRKNINIQELFENEAEKRILETLKDTERITLRRNELHKMPFFISGFINLKEIDLSDNCLTIFPYGLFSNKQIERINLNHNNIEDVPVDIDLLKNLNYLNLAHNPIKTIKDEVIYGGYAAIKEWCKFEKKIRNVESDFKKDIQTFIATGETKQAISLGLEVYNDVNNKELYTDLLILSSRFERVQKEFDIGIIEAKDKMLEINKINYAILNIL